MKTRFSLIKKVKYLLGPFSNLTVNEDRTLWKMTHLSLYDWLSLKKKEQRFKKEIIVCSLQTWRLRHLYTPQPNKCSATVSLSLLHKWTRSAHYTLYTIHKVNISSLNCMKITFYTVGTPTVSLCVLIAREISINLLSTSLGHSLTEFFIPADINFFVTGHLSNHWSTKNGPTQTLSV